MIRIISSKNTWAFDSWASKNNGRNTANNRGFLMFSQLILKCSAGALNNEKMCGQFAPCNDWLR